MIRWEMSHARPVPFVRLIALLSVVLAGFTGCSGSSEHPPTYPVSGTVTWKGQPLEGATLVFIPSDEKGESAAAKSDAQGKFEVTTFKQGDGARPGEYRVRVSKYEEVKRDPKAKNLTYEEEQAAPDFDPTARPTPPPKNLLPKKYESESSSGITHTVTESPTTLNITIE
jgi:hypothetical protein